MEKPTPKRLRVRIDANKCAGSTMCIQTAPAVFGLDSRKQSIVIDPAGDSPARVREAAEQCPVSAIILEDADTGERIFP